jgi:hypothetical protein
VPLVRVDGGSGDARRDRRQLLVARLTEFLARYGSTPELLLSEVDSSLGEPLLVVATGSILHGFGNERSDIDISVVVDRDKLSTLPIVSYEHGLLHDAAYFGASEVEEWPSALRDHPWPPAGGLDRRAWRNRLKALSNSIRFGHGLTLIARDGWDRWVSELQQPWLLERVVEWWRVEAIRYSVGARWLATAKPLLAAQRHCEAILAALESRTAAAGEPFFGAKWLPEKLRMLGDQHGMATLRTVLRTPVTDREAARYSAQYEALLRDLLPADWTRRLRAQLWYAPGVISRRVGDSTLVSRWDLRGVELHDGRLTSAGAHEPIWEGELDALPDPHLLALFVEDMTWLSIVAATG